MSIAKSLQGHDNLITVGDRNFEEKILKASLPMLVDFGAEWCPPCRALEPIYHQLSHDYANRLGFAEMDIDANPATYARFGIRGAPTLIMFKDGREIERIVGPNPRQLKNTLDRLLAKHEIG
jgi:thioredoxin 1